MAEHLKLLLSPPIQRPRVTDEFASCFAADDGSRAPVALVVSPLSKIWRDEVGRDGQGAFLGRGWPEFLAAHGIAVGWFVVVRHEGGAAFTVKAFDTSFCIKEFQAPTVAASIMANKNIKGVYCKPQFIRVMHLDFMEKMMIPAKFVKHYVTNEYLNCQMAVVFSPLGKFWRVKLEKDRSGMFFSGDWSHLVTFHGISEGDVLLIRYEGNMVFKFKAFAINGSVKDFTGHSTRVQQDIGKQQEINPCSFSKKHKSTDESPCCEENKRSKGSMTSLNKASLEKEPDFQTRSPFWIKKEITTYALERVLALPIAFCDGIGLLEYCKITLKTSINSVKCWQVHGMPGKNGSYLLVRGWKRFCQENSLMEGDICTFNVMETTLWHVLITRRKKNINQACYQETTCASSSKRERRNDWPVTEGSKRPIGSLALSNKASKVCTNCDIGPPAWVEKVLNNSSIQNHLSLPAAFCRAIGIREVCTITLKTSLNSTRSWQVQVHPYKNSSHHVTGGWKRFCQENGLKLGDVCTINIVETMLWHVIIARR